VLAAIGSGICGWYNQTIGVHQTEAVWWQMAFTIELTPRARGHLEDLRKRDQQVIVDAVTAQLTHQPDRPTRHRKLLQQNTLAPWELRVGDFRVFYDVNREAERVVVLAVGQKSHNVLRIAGEEIDL